MRTVETGLDTCLPRISTLTRVVGHCTGMTSEEAHKTGALSGSIRVSRRLYALSVRPAGCDHQRREVSRPNPLKYRSRMVAVAVIAAPLHRGLIVGQ